MVARRVITAHDMLYEVVVGARVLCPLHKVFAKGGAKLCRRLYGACPPAMCCTAWGFMFTALSIVPRTVAHYLTRWSPCEGLHVSLVVPVKQASPVWRALPRCGPSSVSP
jgi:hypothetical protein